MRRASMLDLITAVPVMPAGLRISFSPVWRMMNDAVET